MAQPGVDASVSIDAGVDATDARIPVTPIADATETFCASQSSHTFCEDFDDGVPGQFAMKTYGGGSVAPDVSDYASPPDSLWANTPALVGATASAGAFVTTSFLANGSHVRLQAAFEVGAGCVSSRDGVVLAQLTFPSSVLALRTSATESDLEEASYLDDGGFGQGTPYRFTHSLPTADWSVVVVDVNLISASAPATATVEIDGDTVLAAQPLQLATAVAPTVSITLGAAVANGVAQSGGCTVHVDNVVFDAALVNSASIDP